MMIMIRGVANFLERGLYFGATSMLEIFFSPLFVSHAHSNALIFELPKIKSHTLKHRLHPY